MSIYNGAIVAISVKFLTDFETRTKRLRNIYWKRVRLTKLAQIYDCLLFCVFVSDSVCGTIVRV